jgi:hypothetical protein
LAFGGRAARLAGAIRAPKVAAARYGLISRPHLGTSPPRPKRIHDHQPPRSERTERRDGRRLRRCPSSLKEEKKEATAPKRGGRVGTQGGDRPRGPGRSSAHLVEEPEARCPASTAAIARLGAFHGGLDVRRQAFHGRRIETDPSVCPRMSKGDARREPRHEPERTRRRPACLACRVPSCHDSIVHLRRPRRPSGPASSAGRVPQDPGPTKENLARLEINQTQ